MGLYCERRSMGLSSGILFCDNGGVFIGGEAGTAGIAGAVGAGADLFLSNPSKARLISSSKFRASSSGLPAVILAEGILGRAAGVAGSGFGAERGFSAGFTAQEGAELVPAGFGCSSVSVFGAEVAGLCGIPIMTFGGSLGGAMDGFTSTAGLL